MIRLTSIPSTAALARLVECSHRATEATRCGRELPQSVKNCYRHPDVKASIVQETHGKCAYCESKVTHVYWGDVEHIKPKDLFPEKRLEYDNLTLACAVCNGGKGDYYSEEAPILNPYVDLPHDHLVGLGNLLWHRNGSPQGQRTIDLLDLNRQDLCERRKERLDRLSALADRYAREPEGPIKETILAQIREDADDAAEFALVSRSFLLAAHKSVGLQEIG